MKAKCGCRSHGSFLTAKGLEEAAQREADRQWDVDMALTLGYLDKVGSVSGMPLEELHWPPDAFLEEQHRRFHNGS